MVVPQDVEWRITFYYDRRGRSPVQDFIRGLPPNEQARMIHELDLLKLKGMQLTEPHVKHITGKLWELRAGKGRVFYFAYFERTFVMLHGFRKMTPKTPKREIRQVQRNMQEFLRDSENG